MFDNIPVCMLTKQLQTLKTALSTNPEMKHVTSKIKSAHDFSTSSARYCFQIWSRDFFLPRLSSIWCMPFIVEDMSRGRTRKISHKVGKFGYASIVGSESELLMSALHKVRSLRLRPPQLSKIIPITAMEICHGDMTSAVKL